MMVSYRVLASRRGRLVGLVAACVAVGALLGALILPQYFSNATATAVSTLYKTGTNTVNGSAAASPDAPGGAKTGTAKPGDTLKWVVSYQNNTSENAAVNLKDVISQAGAYVPGSLQLPPNPNGQGALAPQYTTDGTTWANGTPPANATGVGFTGTMVPQGTQQVSVKFPAPTSTAVQTSSGDAYNVVVKGSLVYAIYHHRVGAVVYCAKWADGTTCPGWPTNANNQIWSSTVGTPVGTGTSYNGFTAWQGGTWISGDKLFWLQGTGGPGSQGAMGVACLDLSPATPVSCGFTSLGESARDANGSIGATFGGTGMAAANGRLYVTAETPTGNVLICVNPSTGAPCGTVPLTSGSTANNVRISSATFANYVFTSVPTTPGNGTSVWKTYCYNTSTSTLCPGSWPVASAASPTDGGSTFAPVLSTGGGLTGVCSISNLGIPPTTGVCWNLSGVVQGNNPYVGTGAYYDVGNSTSASDVLTVGSKVYLASGNNVICLDFGKYSGSGTVPACSGFTPVPNKYNYTVRPASDVAPNCLVANGDAGQIRLFNALTGGGCLAVSGPTKMSVSPPAYYCGSGTGAFRGWDKLTLTGMTPGTYGSSTVTLRDQNNNVISGFDKVNLSPGATMDISRIPTTVTSIEAEVIVNDINDPNGVVDGQIGLTWKGDPPQMCFQTVAPPVSCDAAAPLTLSNTANAVTTSAAGSDAPGGNTTGAAQFDVKADSSQCSLAFSKTSPVQTAAPGDKVGYSITVKNTGSQTYDKASLTDDLTDVLKDAAYNNDHTASVGAATFQNPILSWSGGLPPGATATITYTVTVKSPDPGDHSMKNTIVSPVGNCTAGSTDPACTVTVDVKVKDVVWHKVDSSASANILTGAAWTFTPVDSGGNPTGPAITVDDCVAAFANLCTGADIDPVGGVFRVTNLGAGTYSLVETKAPSGFILNKTPIPVTVAAASTTVNLPNVVNKQVPVPAIPFTGGLGTDLLTFGGGSVLAVVLGLMVWQFVRRRRSA